MIKGHCYMSPPKIFMKNLNSHKTLAKHLQKCENPLGLKPQKYYEGRH